LNAGHPRAFLLPGWNDVSGSTGSAFTSPFDADASDNELFRWANQLAGLGSRFNVSQDWSRNCHPLPMLAYHE